MAKITHRIPWKMSYAYTEIEFDSEVEAELTDARLVEWANHVAAMEQSAVEFGLGPKVAPMIAEATSRGATPKREYADEAEIHEEEAQRPSNNAPPMRRGVSAGPTCDECGGPTEWSPWRNTAKGEMRFPNCTSGCKNDKGYPLSGRPQYKQQYGGR